LGASAGAQETVTEVIREREEIDGLKPFFREKPKDAAVVEGEALEIACVVAADPPANVQWFKNDLVFVDDSR